MARLRIGSRGSQLALWQAKHVAALLRGRGHQVEIEIIKTTGDRILDAPLSQVGTKGMFIKEIEEALAEGRVDLAVHSLKDLPTSLDARFQLAAITSREDPRDVFLSLHFDSPQSLLSRARVGTSSLRRQAQLKALRRDLEVLPLRGNVDTRLRKLQAGEYDAIVLAAAGVKRLGLSATRQKTLSIEEMCPAAGQGALAIETRAADPAVLECVGFLDDPAARAATACERAALAQLGGGCQVPIGALAEPTKDGLRLAAVVARPDGSELIREVQTGADPAALGAAVGRALLARGADRILRDVYGTDIAVPPQP